MKDLLNQLHQKPEHHKKNIALSVSFVVTIMIFGVWVSVLPSKFNSVGSVAAESQKKLENSITPIATVKASFDEVKNSITGLIGGVTQKEVMLETVVSE